MIPNSSSNVLSPEELRRIRQRQRLSRKTPQQRKKILQYHWRHNEKDGILYYCDYCDVFTSASEKSWSKHLSGTRHMNNVEAYYNLVPLVEEEKWVALNENVTLASHQRQAAK